MIAGLSQCKYIQKRMINTIIIPKKSIIICCMWCCTLWKQNRFCTYKNIKTYIMIDHVMRDIVNYIENYDDNDKDDEKEELIIKLIDTHVIYCCFC